MVFYKETHWHHFITVAFLISSSISISKIQILGFAPKQITHPHTPSNISPFNHYTQGKFSSSISFKASNSNSENANQTGVDESNFSFDPTAASPEPIPMVMEGGPAQIFAMARKMLIWDDSPSASTESNQPRSTTTLDQSLTLPRWHPHAGISDYNPSFRSKAPAMNSMGYANAIRRNSRKRNKPAMWRYAVRTYKRMSPKIPQRNIHHEGALVACSKLGLWEEAFDIFQKVEKLQQMPLKQVPLTPENRSTTRQKYTKPPSITDSMVYSLIKACVRASRQSNNRLAVDNQRRLPLDTLVKEVLIHLPAKYEIQICANHVNPIAAAYQKLGLYEEAYDLIQTYLVDRHHTGKNAASITGNYDSSSSSIPSTMSNVNKAKQKQRSIVKRNKIGENHIVETDSISVHETNEVDEDDYEEDPIERNRLNVLNIGAKDRGSYSLLVKGAAIQGDWKNAVQALEDMTNSGIYPEMECLHTWTEAIEGRAGSPREERHDIMEDSF